MAKTETKIGKGFLERMFEIRPGEFKRVGVMFIYSFFAIGGSMVLGRTVSNALFLARLPAEYIPYRYIGMALALVLASFIYTRLIALVSKVKLNIAIHSVIILVLIALRFMLAYWETSLILLSATYLFFEVMGILIQIQFWTFAGEVFHSREAKRLFGIIASGGIISNVVMGGFVRATSNFLSPPNLIFFIALSVLFCIISVVLLRGEIQEKKRVLTVAAKKASKAHTSFLEDFLRLRQSPQLISIAAIVSITAVVTNISDYQLSVVLKINYNEAQISSFYGAYALIAGIVATLVQVFLTGRVLQRFGILFALLLLPCAMFVGFVSTILWTSLFTIAPTRAADTVFRYTVNDSTLNLLYLPVSTDFRPRAQTIINGMFKPLATGVAGVLFIFMRQWHISLVYFSMLAIVMLAGWIYLAMVTRKQYMNSLAGSLLNRRLDLASADVKIDDATRRFLIKALQHPNPHYVLHSLEIIKNATHIKWDEHVGHLLSHSDPEVKTTVLEFLATQEETRHFSKVIKLLEDEDLNVRAAAIRAICALNPNYAMMAVNRYLHDENPKIKEVAVVGMIKYGGLDGILMAAGELKSMLEHHDWKLRYTGAKVLAELKAASFYHPLIKLINDKYPQVQIEAIHAAGELKSKQLLTLVIYKLVDPRVKTATTKALINYGPIAESALRKVLLNQSESKALRQAVPKILQEIGGEENIKALRDAMRDDDATVRYNAISALANLASKNRETILPIGEIEMALQKEAQLLYQNYRIAADLESLDYHELLTDALQKRREFILDCVCNLLQIRYPDEAMLPVRRGLKSSKKQVWANAVNFIEGLLDTNSHLKKIMEPIFDDIKISEKARFAEEFFDFKPKNPNDRLRELAEGDDKWLQIIAIYLIGIHKMESFEGLVKTKLTSSDEVVQETALKTLSTILSKENLTELLNGLIQNQEFGAKEYARAILQELAA